jgi:uncharacterized surface protein with fasciclin (FAS1) repeats
MQLRAITPIVVLLSAGLLMGISSLTPDEAPPSDRSILAVAQQSNDFHTLVAAIKAAGLEGTLRGDGPYTVFAPTDAAFDKLPPGTVERLLQPENRDQLRNLLTYHVVSGEITSSNLLAASGIFSASGERLPLGLRVGNANVVQADVKADNGVIHVIDTVLMPGAH